MTVTELSTDSHPRSIAAAVSVALTGRAFVSDDFIPKAFLDNSRTFAAVLPDFVDSKYDWNGMRLSEG